MKNLDEIKDKISKYFDNVDPDELYELALKCGFREKPDDKAEFIYFSEGYLDSYHIIAVITDYSRDLLYSIIEECLSSNNISFKDSDINRIVDNLEENKEAIFENLRFEKSLRPINQFIYK